MVDFQSTLKVPDYRSYLYYTAFSRKPRTKYLYGGIAVIGIIWFIWIFAEKKPITPWSILPPILMTFFVPIIMLMIEFNIRKEVKKGNKKINHPRHVSITPNAIHAENCEGTEEKEFLWSNILEGRETKRLFVLYVGPEQAMVYAKSSMTPEQVNELRDMMKKQLKKRFILPGEKPDPRRK